MRVIGVLSGAPSDRHITQYLDAYKRRQGKFSSEVSYTYASDMKKEDYVIEKDALYHFNSIAKSPLMKKIHGIADYVALDTGYLLRGDSGVRGKNPRAKYCWRVVLNEVQNINTMSREEIIERCEIEFNRKDIAQYLDDRFYSFLRQDYSKFKIDAAPRGNKILLVPPSEKSCRYYGITKEWWLNNTINQINSHWTKTHKADIEIREKKKWRARANYSLMDQLHEGHYWCTVTYNSIAAVESAMCGVPCITALRTSAASCISELDIKNINDPYLAHPEKVKQHFYYLTQCQFTPRELSTDALYCLLNAVQKGNFK